MFERPVQSVTKLFPIDEDFEFNSSWVDRVKKCTPEFSSDVNDFISIGKSVLGDTILQGHKINTINFLMANICIVEIVLRPNNSYYEKLGKPIPSPDNPDGPNATGLCLKFSLNRGYKIHNGIIHANATASLQVWGSHERDCFKQFYSNYRRVIERLFEPLDVEFTTACGFESVDRCRGKSISKKLDLYLLELDDENEFSITANFDNKLDQDNMIKSFLAFLAIYDSLYFYAKPKRKNLDRILQHYVKLS